MDANQLSGTLHPPLRKALLAELGRRDPSLAFRVASHLWARDLAGLASGSALISGSAGRWARGEEWACFSPLDSAEIDAGHCSGKAVYVPAAAASAVLLLAREQLIVIDPHAVEHACTVEPEATLGLRGAGLARIVLKHLPLPTARASVDHQRFRRSGIFSVRRIRRQSLRYGRSTVSPGDCTCHESPVFLVFPRRRAWTPSASSARSRR